jgi:hypothetical protein
MTPHTSGTHVTGLVNCNRIFQILVSALAPLTPNNWRTPDVPSSASLFLAHKAVVVVVDDDDVEDVSAVSKGKKGWLLLLLLLGSLDDRRPLWGSMDSA